MTTIKRKILIVEDENSIGNFISTILAANDFDTIISRSGAEAYSMITSQCPDLVLLDLGLPDMDGTQVIKFVRGYTTLPIVVVSARGHERDKIEALDLGADDYITKPFGTGEMLARIRTALRRSNVHNTPDGIAMSGTFKTGGLTIDYAKHQVFVDDKNVQLTQSEYKIVSLLGRHAGRVITYDYILRELYGPHNNGDNLILRVNMANIRRKIEKNPAEPAYIFTEAGVGYRMLEAL